MPWYTCQVSEAGPAADGTETTSPVIYISLTDQGGTFSGQWFYAAENAKDEILAVALSAISTGFLVEAAAVAPNSGGTPYTEVSRLYLIGALVP
jgi:hypothetical protein